jgi:hypothetical protein
MGKSNVIEFQGREGRFHHRVPGGELLSKVVFRRLNQAAA